MFLSRKLRLVQSYIRNCCSLSLTVRQILKSKPFNQTLLVQGWVQAIRKHKDNYFVDLTDGTCSERLQVVLESNKESFPSYGSSIKVEGSVVESTHKGQDIELLARSWETIGKCPEDYPFLYRIKYSSEYVRQHVHMRPRTRTFAATLRIRSYASFAVHNYFQDNGFYFIHTPVITLNDCEGAGEVFSIKVNENPSSNEEITKESTDIQLSTETSDPTNLSDTNEKNDPKEFFYAPAFLTVSGQLHLEAMACSLSRVYNFGPVFRAEKSRSRQHASEFHMIEAEVAFTNSLEELMDIAQALIQRIVTYILDKCDQDISTICEKHTKGQKEYLLKLISNPFVRIPYNEAIAILNNKESTTTPIQWGNDLATEHKDYLVKYCNKTPVFVHMFPASVKPFYMKTCEKTKEAYCFDLFAPFGGELCGGSLREENEDNLKRNLSQLGANPSISWYSDLRKYGTVPHGGFGIGFDRLMQTLLGISNIRDVIPFPRRKHDCRC